MPAKPKPLAPDSVFTDEDQARWYGESLGEEALNRQIVLGRRKRGLCVCVPRRLVLKRETGYMPDKARRTIHAPDCPRRKPWMEDYDGVKV